MPCRSLRNGQPIILLNDRQTIGGYPKIGSVLSLDLNKLVQLPPQSVINFEPISIEEAHNLLQLSAINIQRSQAKVDLDRLSQEIETLLVALNPRGMQTVSSGNPKRVLFAGRPDLFCGATGTDTDWYGVPRQWQL